LFGKITTASQDVLMSIAPYRSVLALPGVLRLLSFAVLARIPTAASSVVVTLFVVLGLDRGYAEAGLVAAVSTIGVAIGGPWRGRALDRVGLRRALVPSVLVEGAVWVCIPFLGYRAVLLAAFIGGLLAVPTFTVVRQSLAVLVPISQQRSAFALDSIGTELSFMVGPSAGVLLATQWSSRGAVVTLGLTTVLSGILLMVVNPPVQAPGGVLDPASAPVPAEPIRSTPVTSVTAGAWKRRWAAQTLMFSPALLAVLAATTAALMVLAGTDVSIVAHARADHQVGLTWMVFTMWSLSSMLGGLIFGAARRSAPLYVLLLALGLFTIPVGLVPDTRWLALAIIPAGFLCAPVISASAAMISRIVPADRLGEAMGWYGSAMTLGIAAGTPAAGTVIDRVGAWAGFALLGTVGVLVATVGLILIGWETDRPSSADRSFPEHSNELGAPSGVSPTRHQTAQV
jgi:MFS family permease